MKTKASMILAAIFALFTAVSANAATLSIVGGTSVNLPGNFSESPLAATGLQVGDTVTAFDSSNSSSEGLALSGSTQVRFEYLGKEAGYTNRAIELGGFGILFNTNTASVGDSVTVTLSPNANGLLPFKFSTSGGGTPADAENGNITNPLAIAFSSITNNSVVALFGDGAGDHDFDDMAIRISVVPLPPALLLFGGALIGLGWIGRRRKAA
ncbi:VPLPA-CTERM sorting domain-containing protein [Sneathiella glossodoripedis]|uniref:VPLPA-CTERM sorting domain-containing protein n=1 Tax=Sneathiella glossodoripedis TaxID=418853 RepID=UPI000560FB1B|nr:VPLPA-CTERM sorting domain-containing protein [Sneathiella glossodoripedis]